MTTVSIADAEKDLPALLQRAQTESVVIRDKDGVHTLLLSMRPKTEAGREAAWERLEALSKEASAELEASLAKDGITVEEFLADALADVLTVCGRRHKLSHQFLLRSEKLAHAVA